MQQRRATQGILLFDQSEKLDSMNLLMYMSPIASVALVPLTLMYERDALQVTIEKAQTSHGASSNNVYPLSFCVYPVICLLRHRIVYPIVTSIHCHYFYPVYPVVVSIQSHIVQLVIVYVDTATQCPTGFVMLLTLNVFLAYFVNLANFLVTRHTSALTLQVLGNAKGVIAAGVSVLLFKNQLTSLGVLGYGITVCGVFAYSEVCSRHKERHEANT